MPEKCKTYAQLRKELQPQAFKTVRPLRSSTAAGYGYRWQLRRAAYLRKHPVCVDCLERNRTTPATEVHHLVKKADGGSDKDENLRGLCKACHSRRTAKGE